MTALDDLTALTYHVQRISQAWPVYARTRADHRRGAYPPRSLGDGGSRGSGSLALPAADAEDRALDAEWDKVNAGLAAARKALAVVEQKLMARITAADRMEDPAPVLCANSRCCTTEIDPYKRVRYAGKLIGVCESCERHWTRHQRHWPERADGTLLHPWVRRGDRIVKLDLADAEVSG